MNMGKDSEVHTVAERTYFETIGMGGRRPTACHARERRLGIFVVSR